AAVLLSSFSGPDERPQRRRQPTEKVRISGAAAPDAGVSDFRLLWFPLQTEEYQDRWCGSGSPSLRTFPFPEKSQFSAVPATPPPAPAGCGRRRRHSEKHCLQIPRRGFHKPLRQRRYPPPFRAKCLLLSEENSGGLPGCFRGRYVLF